MTFRVWGRLDGDPVSATWDGGQLSGSAALLGAAALLVESGARVLVTPTGPDIPASLDDGWSAAITLYWLLTGGGDGFRWGGVEGEPPDPPDWFQMPPFDPDVIY